MKRIVFIAHGLGIGGAQRVAALLANEFAKDGYEVIYIVTRSDERVYQLEKEIKLICKVPKKGILSPIRKNLITYKEVKKYNPDIIISFLTNEMVLCGNLIKCPQIYTLRNDPNNDMNTFFRRKIRNQLYRKASAIVFQTEGAKEYFSKEIQNKGYTIGNPLTDNLPYWNENHHEKTIITACRLDEQKNVQLMIKAFSRFVKTHTEYKMQICGKGPLEQQLKDLCKVLAIDKCVEFLGFRKDVHELMTQAEMFVLSSNYEGISNSMLEALAIGIPTICTNSPPGGAAQYIQNGKNGILIPVGDEDALFDGMRVISDNNSLRQQLSSESIQIRKELDIKTIYRKWDALQRELCNRRTNSGD